jgi:hypothetical protein
LTGFRWLAVPAALALGIIGTPRVSAAGGDVPAYLNAHGGWVVASDASWKTARIVSPRTGYLGGLVNPAAGVESHTVWSRTCSRAPQTATFVRVINVPGPPSAADFAWSGPSRGNAVHPWLTAITLSVNGSTVLRINPKARAGVKALAATAMTHFVVGRNIVTVRASKSANPASAGCGASGAPFGLRFALEGTSAAYLAVTAPSGARVRFVRTRALTLSGTIAVRNYGPSAALDTQLIFDSDLNAPATVVTTITPSQGSCVSTVPTSGFSEDRCSLGSLSPGSTASISISSRVAVDEGDQGTVATTYAWRAVDIDPTFYTEGSSYFADFYLCGTASTEVSCATAPTSSTGSP